MPRPSKDGAGQPKKRSRTGCWPCKMRKVKCGEEKPVCVNCLANREPCDYSIRLNWDGRSGKGKDGKSIDPDTLSFVTAPALARSTSTSSPRDGRDVVFSAQHIVTAPQRPSSSHRTDRSLHDPSPNETGPRPDPRLWLGRHSSPRNNAQDQTRLRPSDQHAKHPPLMLAPGNDEPTAKRMKLSPTDIAPRATSPVVAIAQCSITVESPSMHVPTHVVWGVGNTPVTPGSSGQAGLSCPSPPAICAQRPPGLQRLSVESLLSDPTQVSESLPNGSPAGAHGDRMYGYDHGWEDKDIPHNDDMHVVQPQSTDLHHPGPAVLETSSPRGEAVDKRIAFEPGGYYAQPVPIRIPQTLEPLPDELTRNPMNLLYFHHFINHTGRILVSHDCPENPFRGVLAPMAVRDPHQLRLLLCFSASHRARLLGHHEPAKRIAEWMSDVIPALRRALDAPILPDATGARDPTSLAPLATAIMLATLEIISPNTLAVPIPWQHHLRVARNTIVANGGLHHLAQKAGGARDKAIFCLSRWFAYLDVLGSLSGSKQEPPLFGAYLEDGGGLWLVNRREDEMYQVDCLYGFSGHCIALLAQVAGLAARCDRQRIDPITKQVRAGWQPPDDARRLAEDLRQRLDTSATTVYRGCTHPDPRDSDDDPEDEKEDEEMHATNEAYHWAGQIHLAKRVLALPPHHPDVQECVQRVIRSLQRVRRGSSAESCLLFPMFSAGCEAQAPRDRRLVMDRMTAVEGWGMEHVGRARTLMQAVWDMGKPWETMVDGEFFG